MDRGLHIFFIASLIFSLSRAFIDSLVPLYLQAMGAQATEISATVTAAGLIATACMSTSPYLTQRYGAKSLLIASSALGVIPPVALSLSDQWLSAAPWILLHHVVFAVNLPARMLFIAEQSRQGAMGRVFGYMNLVWPISGILGPTLGGWVADTWGWPSVFILQGSSALISIVPFFWLPTTTPPEPPLPSSNASYRELFHLPALQTSIVGFTLSQLLSCASVGLADLVIPLYLTNHFGFTTTTVGVFFSIGGGVSTLITQIPSGYVADKMGGRALMLRALTVIPFAFFLYPFILDGLLLLLLYMTVSGFRSATWPASMAYLLTLVPSQLRSVAIGLRQIANRLGFTLGPLIGGISWQYTNPTLTFLLASGLSAVAVCALLPVSESPEAT
jgi:DHA1 family multidrug resistance protein-like MFS transporter